MPAVSIVQNSDRVMARRYGRTAVADSMPTKILLAAHRLSAPLIFIRRVKNHENPRMITGMIRQ